MHGGGSIYLSSHSRLTMPCCQSLLNERSSRSAGDATDGEADPTCRVSSSSNSIKQQAVTAYQPLRNRSWAPPCRAATPSKRYCQLGCSMTTIAIQSHVTHEQKKRSQGASKYPLIIPRQWVMINMWTASLGTAQGKTPHYTQTRVVSRLCLNMLVLCL